MTQKEAQERKINSLADEAKTTSIGEEDVKSSPLYIEISSKLSVTERKNEELQYELQSTRDRWAVTKGDLKLSHKTIDDLEEKHKRRLKELSGELAEGSDGIAVRKEMEHGTRKANS